uniref:NADH-ubiquinone oxidoreductase chain 5 n=2 Tax=Macrocheraia grandis TaxID=2653828 RepID=A0A4Y1KB43_9HEMI|nr:NADH dehydrogenase subunit 5 [Macrocheraia grandis]QFP99284.1 NADH dehydrogenase subunit 5 [Macrocheraia grandis grandis]
MIYYKIWGIILFFFGVFFYIIGLWFLFNDFVLLIDWEFFSLMSCSFVMTLLMDWMSLLFMGSVLFISSMVLIYSFSYMCNDLMSIRFMYLVILFIFSMMMMIISPNLVSILVGWDGLGLVSYCLVIYFNNIKSYNAGMLTILVNRIGDIGILLSIAFMFNNGSWYFLYYNFYVYNYSYLLFFFIIIAGFTKSAQIPFSSWLPAAMAAPTPVSALVHSSTLVTAGVYLLIRFSSAFSFFNTYFFLVISVMTMFLSAFSSMFEFDLSSIIALSTLSQLGFMMSIMFVGSISLSFFHLLTHAFFKALLFLCAGLIIHCLNNNQDIRYMGVLVNHMPFTISCFCVANMSLCGLPFLSGFYSSDFILEYMQFNFFNLFIYFMYFISIGLTVAYTMRLMFFLLFNYTGLLSYGSYEEDFFMMFSMIFLVFLSITSGSFLSWLLFSCPLLFVLPLLCKLLPFFVIFLGGVIGYFLFFINFGFVVSSFYFPYFFGNMWFLPDFINYFSYSALSSSFYYEDFINMGWGEYLFSSSFMIMFNFMGKIIFICQNNSFKLFFSSFVLVSFMFFI